MSRNWHFSHWGIRGRVLFLAIVPLTAMVLVLSLLFLHSRISQIDQTLLDRGQAIARQLAPACEYGVVAGNNEILTRLARAALRETGVTGVVIADDKGAPIAHASVLAQHDTQLIPLIPLPAAVAVEHTEKNGTHVFRAPIYRSQVELDDPAGEENSSASPAGRRQIGWVNVELSAASTRMEQQRVLLEGLAITLGGLVLTTLIALRMARGVTEPLVQLTRAVARIRDGDLGQTVVVRSGGELGELESGFNAMASGLAQAQEAEKKRASDALFMEQVRAQVTLASIGDGVISTDAHGCVTYLNPVAEQFMGVSSAAAQGRRLEEVFRIVDEVSNEPSRYPLNFCLDEGRIIRHDSHHLLINNEGGRIEIQDSAAPIRDRDGAIIGAVVVFHDVTEIQQMVRRMAFLASHDPLTGLLNRREFENHLQQAHAASLADGSEHALAYIDLDQFKIVNDTCGHAAGDELLRQLAHHLSRDIRTSDVLARLGGDEFGVILENCPIERAIRISEAIRQSVNSFRFVWGNRTFEVGASIGLVPVNADSGTLSELLSAADSACYVAKDRGRNRIHVYQPDDAALAQRQGEMQWVQRLREALDSNHFDLYAQAIVPLASAGERNFYEVLVRLHDQDLVVIPGRFIPAAERYHLMPVIDRWVVYATLALLRIPSGNDAERAGMAFAINLSGQTLGDESFLNFIQDEITACGIDPRRLCFEITETAAIANLPRARHFIQQLKQIGCRFALDDFGSGLSSFGYLKSLPVDYLKIAGDFIRDVAEDPVDHAMVDAINQIGRVMGISTIAEAVENEAAFDRLRSLEVGYAQGNGIEPPRPLWDVLGISQEEWVALRAGVHLAIRPPTGPRRG